MYTLLFFRMVHATLMPYLPQPTSTSQPACVTTPTKCCLKLDLNLNLVPKRTVSEDLFYVRIIRINILQVPMLFETLNKIKLSHFQFQVTSFADFRACITTFTNFETYGQKLLAHAFGVNFNGHDFNHMDANLTEYRSYENNLRVLFLRAPNTCWGRLWQVRHQCGIDHLEKQWCVHLWVMDTACMFKALHEKFCGVLDKF